MKMLTETVLCYLKKDDCYLLLFRNKKKNDCNEGKWIGVGGHIEKGESKDEAAIREIKEETGLDAHNVKCVGEVLFVNDDYQEMMYVYEVRDFSGQLITCDEGELRWVPVKEIDNYPMWEGDKEFLPLLFKGEKYFKMKLTYKNKDLISVEKY